MKVGNLGIVGIVGQGAIGSLFAYYFRQVSPILLLKDVNKPCKQLLTLENLKIKLDFQRINVSQDYISGDQTKKFDAIIIAVKGYQLEALIKQLAPWLPSCTRIVLIQNGMGGAQILASAFPNHRIYTGTTTDAVYGVDENIYQITALGKLDIGPLWEMSSCSGYKPQILNAHEEKRWATEFFSWHPNVEYHHDIAPALFTKLAINAVINPLTANLHIKNGQLVHYPEQVNELKAEVFAIYSAEKIKYSKKELSTAIDKVIEATSNNWSSMQQDVEHHRQTENETVLGYLLTIAQLHDVHTPLIKTLYLYLKACDQQAYSNMKKKA